MKAHGDFSTTPAVVSVKPQVSWGEASASYVTDLQYFWIDAVLCFVRNIVWWVFKSTLRYMYSPMVLWKKSEWAESKSFNKNFLPGMIAVMCIPWKHFWHSVLIILRRLIGQDCTAEEGQVGWNGSELSMEAEKANATVRVSKPFQSPLQAIGFCWREQRLLHNAPLRGF